MEISHKLLPDETLRQVILSFVLREGTDYSHDDHNTETKIEQVLRQLDQGLAVLVFDPEDESINIIPKH